MKQVCENCQHTYRQTEMVAAPTCQWICTDCFFEDPEAYGLDFDLEDFLDD